MKIEDEVRNYLKYSGMDYYWVFRSKLISENELELELLRKNSLYPQRIHKVVHPDETFVLPELFENVRATADRGKTWKN